MRERSEQPADALCGLLGERSDLVAAGNTCARPASFFEANCMPMRSRYAVPRNGIFFDPVDFFLLIKYSL